MFRHGHPACKGDLLLESNNGRVFCALASILRQASPFFAGLLEDPVTRLDGALPAYILDFDGDTVCAMLKAIYPGPSGSIETISLALKCADLADAYHLSYTLFPLNSLLLSDDDIRANPFVVCVLAWNSCQWSLVERASRFTHQLDLKDLMPEAMEMTGGTEVLAALLATELERAERILEVAGRLPGGILCSSCCKSGRNVTTALVTAIGQVFEEPYPDLSRVFDKAETLATPHFLLGCSSGGCITAMDRYAITEQHYTACKAALSSVPQTILPKIIKAKADSVDGWINAMWSNGYM